MLQVNMLMRYYQVKDETIKIESESLGKLKNRIQGENVLVNSNSIVKQMVMFQSISILICDIHFSLIILSYVHIIL